MSDLSRSVEDVDEAGIAFHAFEDASAFDEAGKTPLREGLPPSYRMRADAHYVDQLAAPPALTVQMIAPQAIAQEPPAAPAPPALVESVRRHGVLEPLMVQRREGRYQLVMGRKRLAAAAAAGLREVPCVVRRVSDEEVRALAAAAGDASSASSSTPCEVSRLDADVAGALAAALTCTSMFSESASPLSRGVAVETMRAEVHRAQSTLHAARVLREGVGEMRRLRGGDQLVQQIAGALAPEARLRGISVRTAATADSVRVAVDEDSVVRVMCGVATLLVTALERGDGARLEISATPHEDGVVLSVEQEGVVVPNAWLSERAGGGAPLIMLEALRRVAAAHEGRVTITRLPHGTRVSLVLPRMERALA